MFIHVQHCSTTLNDFVKTAWTTIKTGALKCHEQSPPCQLPWATSNSPTTFVTSCQRREWVIAPTDFLRSAGPFVQPFFPGCCWCGNCNCVKVAHSHSLYYPICQPGEYHTTNPYMKYNLRGPFRCWHRTPEAYGGTSSSCNWICSHVPT